MRTYSIQTFARPARPFSFSAPAYRWVAASLTALSLAACGPSEDAELLAVPRAANVVLPEATFRAAPADSPSPASLYCIDSTAPVVTVTRPTAGDTLIGGSTTTIAWRAADLCDDGSAGKIVEQKVRFSCSGAEPFELEATLSGDPRSYSWNVPCVTCMGARVRVRAFDKAGNKNDPIAESGPFNIVKGPGCYSPPPDPHPCAVGPHPLPCLDTSVSPRSR